MPAVFVRQTEFIDDATIAEQIRQKPFDKGNGKRCVMMSRTADVLVKSSVRVCVHACVRATMSTYSTVVRLVLCACNLTTLCIFFQLINSEKLILLSFVKSL